MRRRGNAAGLFGACALVVMVAGTVAPAYAASDIVLYPSDFATMHGNWAIATSTGSAGGQKLSSTDSGWATANSPLASPADYVDATFSAASATPYHVWVRLRAANDSKYNDSLWMQFSDAVDANASATYRIGSTSGFLVNLENCAGCGVAGWGWQDKAYWLQQASVVRFASSGMHTIRIQTREDGLQIDEVVLSPATYLTRSPGQVTNDSTIVAKSATSATTVTASTPYSGTPAAIPGTIQAENFDNGGEGVAYHDTSSGNSGGAFRQTNVDIEPSSTGSYDIGWISGGEWLNYSVTVAPAGTYTAQFQVASSGQGGTFHLEMNGTNVSGAISIPNTGGWQTWKTVSTPVTLAAGPQTARLVMDSVGGSGAVGNIDWIQFTAATTSVATSPGAPAVPNSPNPPSGTVGVTVTPNLSWKAAGATSYEIRLGASNPPATVVSNTADYWYAPSPLGSGTNYYFQIVAKNSSGSTAGPVWSFTTTGASSTPPPTPPQPPAPVGGSELIVAEWNIQVNDSSAAHARTVIDYLAALSPRPQVIVMAEAHGTQYNTYLDELQNRTSMTWQGVFQPHCPPGKWSGSSCSATEDEGVAVLTSLPVVGSGKSYLPYADSWHSARALARLAVSVSGVTVQVFGTHLQVSNATARYSSIAYLKTYAANYSTPQLVAGDFNADPDQIDTTSGMSPNFVDSWFAVNSTRGLTCSTPSPTMKLDYWFSDASGKARPNWSSVVTTTGSISDHFGVHTSFTVRP